MTEPLVTFPELIAARFERREKRFIVHAVGESDGRALRAHLADPGRLACLQPGVRLWLSGPYPKPRKLRWSVRLVETPHVGHDVDDPVLLSLDSTLANRAVPVWLEQENGGIHPLPGVADMRTEVRIGDHRVDLAWGQDDALTHVAEIKTVGHAVPGGRGLWPDAPSERGRRHVELLHRLVRQGIPSTVVFCASRADIEVISPHRDLDPALADALDEAVDAGVGCIGLRLRNTLAGTWADGTLPVDLYR